VPEVSGVVTGERDDAERVGLATSDRGGHSAVNRRADVVVAVIQDGAVQIKMFDELCQHLLAGLGPRSTHSPSAAGWRRRAPWPDGPARCPPIWARMPAPTAVGSELLISCQLAESIENSSVTE
jgi:hypothetical protein